MACKFLPYLCLFLSALGISCSTPPIAETPLGKVRGHRMLSRAGREFLAFSGLPYAKPPLGELRFEPPVPVEPWTGTKDALEDGPWCPQFSKLERHTEPFGVEDCLYLSLYTHDLSGKAPVLVHIHGGGFIAGNGARRTGPQYLMDEDLVIVDVNYRLSFLGFLSFEDSEMPGNQGLKDQVMALRWVQENIASFGGDPSRVTIVGESAGGVSVTHHTVSPLSKGLFHRVIAESGASYNLWAVGVPGSARNKTMGLLSALGCEASSTKEALACLRGKDAIEIVKLTGGVSGPVLEPHHPGAFLVGPIGEWQHQQVPIIAGMTSAEGLMFTLFFQNAGSSYEEYYKNFLTAAPQSLGFEEYSSQPQEVARALRDYYFPEGKLTEKDFVNFTMMHSDLFFYIGILDFANQTKGKVFMYYFDYLGKYSVGGDPKDSHMIGAFHTDETIYLWQIEQYKNLEGEDLNISKKIVKLWANFANGGNPATSEIAWDERTPDRHRYLSISKDGFQMKEGFAEERYKFWKTLKYDDLLAW